MRFVFAYAGIPSGAAYDYVEKKKASLTGSTTEFLGCPLGPRGSPFTKRHADILLKKFWELSKRDIDEASGFSTSGFAIICVTSDAESTSRFVSTFFPSILVVPVEWEETGRTPDERTVSHKKLFEALLKATVRARNSIEVLHKELKEQSNKTSLLLPLRNFHSKFLEASLQDLQSRIVAQDDKPSAEGVLKDVLADFEFRHPRNKSDTAEKRTFSDDRAIEFKAPGKAKHGVPDFGQVHPTHRCILGGFRRLGAPFHAAFHYDAQKDPPRKLKGRFCMCHGDFDKLKGDPHLNIFPNDFIRNQKLPEVKSEAQTQ